MLNVKKEAENMAIKKLLECAKNDDIEIAHIDADNALCNLLIVLGYENIVNLYRKVSKWYA